MKDEVTAKGIALRSAVIFAIIGTIFFVLSVILKTENVLVLGVVMFIFCSLCFCIANGVDESTIKKKKVHPIKIISIKTNNPPVSTVCAISND